MKNPTTRVLSASLLLALSAAAPAAEKDVDFRSDAFVGQQDGYHTYGTVCIEWIPCRNS